MIIVNVALLTNDLLIKDSPAPSLKRALGFYISYYRDVPSLSNPCRSEDYNRYYYQLWLMSTSVKLDHDFLLDIVVSYIPNNAFCGPNHKPKKKRVSKKKSV